jgi:hypothetical protein
LSWRALIPGLFHQCEGGDGRKATPIGHLGFAGKAQSFAWTEMSSRRVIASSRSQGPLIGRAVALIEADCGVLMNGLNQQRTVVIQGTDQAEIVRTKVGGRDIL